MQIISSIWNHLAGFFGNLVLIAGVIGLVIGLIERLIYKSGRSQEKADENRQDVRKELIGDQAQAGNGKEEGEEQRQGEKQRQGERQSQIFSSPKTRLAIITGASSGLGMAYAKAVDQDPEAYQVDEIWLIARRKDRLDQLASELHLPVQVLPLDLTKEESLEELKRRLEGCDRRNGPFDSENRNLTEEKPEGNTEGKSVQNYSVSLLLNCAGFGAFGSSEEVGYVKEGKMIDLNDRAAAQLTNIVIPYLSVGARIGEVCSVAGFQPIPFFNAYAASKAFLYSYSRGLRVELLKKKVSVTAICPYWIRDTGFIDTAADGKKHHLLFTSKTGHVAASSLSAVRKRHAVSTPSFISTLDRIFCGLIPDNLLAYIMTRFL